MKKKLCAAALLTALFTSIHASAWESTHIQMSAWATGEVQSAYNSGAVSEAFDLGADYTRPITRGELARLTVDLILHERQQPIDDLIAQLGVTLQAVPLVPAQPEGQTEPETPAESTDNAGDDADTPDDPAEAPATIPEQADSAQEDTDAPQQSAPTLDEPGAPTDGVDTSIENTDEPAENAAPSASGDDSIPEDAPTPSDGTDVPETDTNISDGEANTTPDDADSPADGSNNPTDEQDSPAGGVDDPADEPEPPAGQDMPAWGDPLDGGLPFVASGSFGDTQSVYIELAARLGIVNGTDGLFRPNDPVSRAEAAAMMQRCMGVLGFSEANQQPQQFSDAYAIPRWAVQSVKYISGRTDTAGQAIMGGSGGKFSPLDTYTVEQAILSLRRMQSSLAVTTVAADWRNAPGYNTVQLALTFGGDCTLGRGHNFAYSGSLDEMYDNKGAAYFFSGIPEFFNDDLTMVNFEGTLTTSTAYANKTFVFKGRPEYVNILTAGSIDVVTVANNHSMDYLQRGFDDTIRYLSPYVAVSGYDYLPIVTVKGVRIGFASNVGWSYDAAQRNYIDNAIQNLRQRGAELIVFNYHWGVERAYRSNSTQQDIAHYCIDKGADLVIGHHPHVVQEVETYKGKQISYSLGNLVFGGNNNPSDKNCLIFRQNFTVDLDTRKITASSYQAIPYKVSSVSWRNDYRPTKS